MPLTAENVSKIISQRTQIQPWEIEKMANIGPDSTMTGEEIRAYVETLKRLTESLEADAEQVESAGVKELEQVPKKSLAGCLESLGRFQNLIRGSLNIANIQRSAKIGLSATTPPKKSKKSS